MITINLDATVLGSSGCILALKRKTIDGLTEPAFGASLIYGVAVHKYIDTMFRTKGNIPIARAEAVKAFNVPKIDKPKQAHLSDQNHMLCTAFNTWEMYVKEDKEFEVLEIEGKPLTELTFSIPYYKDDHIIVNLCGTIDSVGKIKNGCYAIRDWKTTSTWDARSYFTTYELSRQLRLYVLALKLMSKIAPDSALGVIGASNVGAFIDAIFIKPAPNDNFYARSPVYTYSKRELDEFQQTLDEKIREFSFAVANNHFPKQGILNGCCEAKWGKCMFWKPCTVSDEVAEILLKRDFKQRTFNPLTYNE